MKCSENEHKLQPLTTVDDNHKTTRDIKKQLQKSSLHLKPLGTCQKRKINFFVYGLVLRSFLYTLVGSQSARIETIKNASKSEANCRFEYYFPVKAKVKHLNKALGSVAGLVLSAAQLIELEESLILNKEEGFFSRRGHSRDLLLRHATLCHTTFTLYYLVINN